MMTMMETSLTARGIYDRGVPVPPTLPLSYRNLCPTPLGGGILGARVIFDIAEKN